MRVATLVSVLAFMASLFGLGVLVLCGRDGDAPEAERSQEPLERHAEATVAVRIVGLRLGFERELESRFGHRRGFYFCGLTTPEVASCPSLLSLGVT